MPSLARIMSWASFRATRVVPQRCCMSKDQALVMPSSFWILGPTGQLRYSLISSPDQMTRSMSLAGSRPE